VVDKPATFSGVKRKLPKDESRPRAAISSYKSNVPCGILQLAEQPNFGLPGGGSAVAVDVPGGASITNTSTDNRQSEFALKYTF